MCIFLIAITKGQISYAPLDPVGNFVHILDLKLDSVLAEKCYLTKILNLNFKLKFQTQNRISKTIVFPFSRVIRDSGKLAPRVKVIKSTKQ